MSHTLPLSFETFFQPKKLVVDREARLIKGVKILGLSSSNNRRYTPKAIREAVELYRDKPVYTNHPLDPTTGKPDGKRSRTVEEKFGAIRNVEVREDGIYGDIRYLSTHPMTARVLEAAEEFPEAFGMSHAAQLKGKFGGDGVFEVDHIPAVRSVDIVCEPGTVTGLHESRSTMTTLKVFFESLIPKFHKSKQKILRAVFEEDMMPPDAPMDAPAGESDPDEAMKAGFKAAIDAVWQQYCDGTLDAAAAGKKVTEFLKTHAKLGDKAEEPAEEPDADDKATESSRMWSAIALCNEAKISPTPVLMKALVAFESDDDRRAMVNQHKAAFESTSPRSSGPGGGKKTATAEPELPQNAAEFAKRIKTR
jgi:hypothetical protein